ncbi:hypothetical protein, partial [Porphyromonas uenonis]|uniref:hypothetical protein n=1 Tax=Porphyromonas uenonis TaxID=281920 RepID=UPI0026EF01EF
PTTVTRLALTQRTHDRASVPVKTTDTVTFDTTDAQIVRPYKGLLVLCVPTTTSLAVVALC